MSVALFLFFHVRHRPERRIAAEDLQRVIEIARRTPALSEAHVYTPAAAHDLFLNDPPSPQLAVQLFFADLPALEAACAPDGALQALAAPVTMPSLAGATVTQQAMLVRKFPVPDATFRPPPNGFVATYLVEYPGAAEDLNQWLWYYIVNHPPLMARMPGIRRVEIYTRLDWCSFLPWTRVNVMQRNKVAFDSLEALQTSLNSDVRKEMRADFEKFPPFTGGNIHYPMHTRIIGG